MERRSQKINVPNIPIIDSDQVTIAVMGATGTGKSTFINLVSGSNLPVSPGLASCTQDVKVSLSFKLDGRTVTLIDTPGFDDTDRSEVEILQVIAEFLATHYRKGTTLHGVIYLHRISDNRMGGAPKRSFRLFRKVCGDETLKNVVIVSTMWSKVLEKEGQAREKELITDARFFKAALDEKATILRHHDTVASAHHIIRTVFKNHPLPLSIQQEMVHDSKPIPMTKAGQHLGKELENFIQKFNEDIKKLQVEVRDMQIIGEKAVEEVKEELSKANTALDRLQRDLENLRSLNLPSVPHKKKVKAAVNGDTGLRRWRIFRKS